MTARRPRSHLKTRSSLSRINLLHELQVHGSMTVVELADAIGLHHNTARAHLHRLIDAGFVHSEPTAVDRQFDMLDDHMNQCGFDAQVDLDASQMTMHSCPFAYIARDNPQACEVHFALVKDALELIDGPLTAQALHQFSGPDVCTVGLDDDSARTK